MTFVFDYDGTIHNGLKIYADSFRKCCELMRMEGIDVRNYSDEEIKKWIGMDVNSMWEDFQKDIAEEKKKKYGDFIGKTMVELTEAGEAELYDSVLDTISEIRNFGKTVFLSNCKRSYMEAHIRKFRLDDYFDGFYCAEDYNFNPKYTIFKEIKNIYDGLFVVVGDRYSDIETAVMNGAVSIGCLYGYGKANELEKADIKVKNPNELREALLCEAHKFMI